jgi:hypothetical protein
MDILDTNPLIAHLKHQPTRLTLRRTLWLGFGLGLLSLGISTAAVLTTRAQQFGFFANMLFKTGWLITALTPFLTAVTAAALTRRATRPDRFDLIRLTPLGSKTLLHALVFTVLYRMRLVYVVLVIVMPVLVVEVFFALVTFEVPVYYYLLSAPRYWEVVTPTLYALAVVLFLWTLNLLGAMAGVRSGLLRTSTAAAVVNAPLAMSTITFVVCLLYGYVVWGFLGNLHGAALVVSILGSTPFLIRIPYALATRMLDGTLNDWKY